MIPGAGLCRNWQTSGACHFGASCRFAHLGPDGKPTHTPPSSQNTPCRNFQTTGTCRFGASCHYAHVAGASTSPGPPQGQHQAAPAATQQTGPPAAPQEYETYLDKETGHHRLKGGAMEIRDPTEEEKAAAAQ